MTSVTSPAQQNSQGKLRLKREVLRRLLKTGSDCADVTWCGKLFQTREMATGKARYVDSRVCEVYTGCANKKNNPLGKIHYVSYCKRFFHQIYSFYRGGNPYYHD